MMIGREISNRRRVILFCRRSQQFGKERLQDFAYQHPYPSRMDPVVERPPCLSGAFRSRRRTGRYGREDNPSFHVKNKSAFRRRGSARYDFEFNGTAVG